MPNKTLSAYFHFCHGLVFSAIFCKAFGTCHYLEKTSFCTKTVVPTYGINYKSGENNVCPIYIVFDDVNKQNPGVRDIDKAVIV